MQAHASRSTASVRWLVLICLLPGCRPHPQPPAMQSIAQLSAEAFSADPLQVRLARAVDAADASAVEAAVRAGADVHAWGADGYSILYWAMSRRNVDGFDLLLKHGADITGEYRDPAVAKDPRSRDFVIRLALEVPDIRYLRAGLRHGLHPDYVLDTASNESLLFLASRRHNEAAADMLLDAGAAIEHQNHLGYTALGEAMLRRDFKTMWFLMGHGAEPVTGREQRSDVISLLKQYGSRGVRPEQREYFEKVVDELVRRGLLTRQDIVEADKPKGAVPGVEAGGTVIEHSPLSEAGQAIRQLDTSEREAAARGK